MVTPRGRLKAGDPMAEVRFPNEGSIPEFLAALASPEGTHGVVSAAAVAGAMGASLLQMVALLPQTLRESDEEQSALATATAALARIQEEFLETIETDTAVKLFAARNMPHRGEAERVRREHAIQVALRAAADVPLEVMRLCARGLQHAASLASRSPRAACSDVELAVALLETAFTGARSSLEAKLPSLTDAVHVTSIAAQVAHLSRDAAGAGDAVKAVVRLPPA
jgi:methenyltetrahydrofolate cyclohydrolase